MFMYTVRPFALFKVCAEPRSLSTLSKHYKRNQNKVNSLKRKTPGFYARGRKSLCINNLHSGYPFAPVILGEV
jgi:hypothetical protein